MSAYAIGSISASMSIGGLLGLIGNFLGLPALWSRVALVAGTAVLSLMELGLVRRPIPRIRRQTGKLWRDRYGPVRSAFFWGADLGFGVTTQVTFASFWALLASCIVVANPGWGALLFGGYGLGRALLVASGPILAHQFPAGLLPPLLLERNRSWHRLHGGILAAMAIAVVLLNLRF